MEEEKRWKEDIYLQTQGHVDIDEHHPNLGRYLGPNFFEDVEWWDKARELLTPKENAWIDRRFDNLFTSETVLFADKSRTSLNMFNTLMDGRISLRVLPIDSYIQSPTVGHIIFDLLFKTEDSVKKMVKTLNNTSEEMVRETKKRALFKPDPEFGTLIDKVKQIQIERAIVEMSRIQRG